MLAFACASQSAARHFVGIPPPKDSVAEAIGHSASVRQAHARSRAARHENVGKMQHLQVAAGGAAPHVTDAAN